MSLVKVRLHPKTELPLSPGDEAAFFFNPGAKRPKGLSYATKAKAKDDIDSYNCFLDINNYELRKTDEKNEPAKTSGSALW